jgi:hypothetical protein
MNLKNLLLLIILIFISYTVKAQEIDNFLDAYYFNKIRNSERIKEYKDIQGSPYLNENFVSGELYFIDTSAFRLPLRYNIYNDEMEYQLNDNNFVVDNPQMLNKIVINKSVFVYLPFIEKGGYFELLVSGKSFLVQKRIVTFKPAEGPKPIEGADIPAKFIKEKDKFYIVLNNTETIRIDKLKTLVGALNDKKAIIESFLKSERIKNTKKENLIKIMEYYNSL